MKIRLDQCRSWSKAIVQRFYITRPKFVGVLNMKKKKKREVSGKRFEAFTINNFVNVCVGIKVHSFSYFRVSSKLLS